MLHLREEGALSYLASQDYSTKKEAEKDLEALNAELEPILREE
jgi:hypothetical protein